MPDSEPFNRIPNQHDSLPVILDLLADKRLLWNTEVPDLVAIHFDLTAEECQWIRPHDRTRNRTYLNETATGPRGTSIPWVASH